MAMDGFALGKLQIETLELTAHQKEALKSILSGKDTFVCLPTGHGKSNDCHDYLYGTSSPEQGQPSSVIVVSALISLMVSQVNDLHK